MLGSGYVIEHCVAVLAKERKTEEYQVYMTDCVAAIAKGLGAKISRRFYDIIHPTARDNRTPQEIIADITARAGLKVVKKST